MRTAIAWVACILVVGCGGNGPDINSTQDNVCDQVANVACWDMYQCCSEGEIENFLGVNDPRTIDECYADVHTMCERELAQINFSLKNNRLKLDSKIMNECLRSLVAPEGECVMVSAMLPWTEQCMLDMQDAWWSGTVADGNACDFGNECSRDSFCNASRVCAALPGDGMACSIQGCATGLYCGDGICHPLRGQGSTCTSMLPMQCQKGLFCDLAGSRTCTPLHAIGEACPGNGTCVSGGTCLSGTCAGTGGTCFSATSCSPHCEATNAFCTTDATCSNNMGTCSMGGAACSPTVACTGVGNTCVYPVKCLPAACDGNIVCAEAHAVVNYCQGALAALPYFDPQEFIVGVGLDRRDRERVRDARLSDSPTDGSVVQTSSRISLPVFSPVNSLSSAVGN